MLSPPPPDLFFAPESAIADEESRANESAEAVPKGAPVLAPQRELHDGEALMEHASWHLAKTIPAIVGNTLWPTSGLKAGVRAAGSARRVLLVEKAVAELDSCDPRMFEMAGVEVSAPELTE